MQKQAEYAKICKKYAKYVKICKHYAKICKNMQKYAIYGDSVIQPNIGFPNTL